jgi:hypothetical protein
MINYSVDKINKNQVVLQVMVVSIGTEIKRLHKYCESPPILILWKYFEVKLAGKKTLSIML